MTTLDPPSLTTFTRVAGGGGLVVGGWNDVDAGVGKDIMRDQFMLKEVNQLPPTSNPEAVGRTSFPNRKSPFYKALELLTKEYPAGTIIEFAHYSRPRTAFEIADEVAEGRRAVPRGWTWVFHPRHDMVDRREISKLYVTWHQSPNTTNNEAST